MTQKEKAKRYEQALERAEGLIDFCSDSELKTLEYVFPELKEESEDERIRQEIIDSIKRSMEDMSDSTKVIYNSWLNWLEKQGEQKLAWREEDDIGLDDALWCCKQAASIAKDENDMGNAWYAEKWLKSLKQRMEE